ncbi:MAG: 1,4-dihydroxy-2-naphthoate octaprenyltransferase [Chloroflexi bacterium]|nr:1,4-dihydroxy-2-naphthoate octaprenyltransferase [Chloroflexota bacterium]
MERKEGAWGRVWRKASPWYRASRPFTLSASAVPVLVGSALAFREGKASFGLFLLVLVASMLVQVTANLVDEYADAARPEGKAKLPAPYKVIALGLLSTTAVKRGALAFFAAATIIGLYLVAVAGWPVLAICLASALVAYLYSAGPRPLGAMALGQPLVFLIMGPAMVMGTYYVHARAFTPETLWLSLPVGCTVTAILAANDLRDEEEDRAAGKRTLVTLLGRRFGRWEWTALAAAAFLLVLALARVAGLGALALLPLLALPPAGVALRAVWRGRGRAELASSLRASAQLHWWLGLLLAAGVALGRLVPS